MSQQQLRLVICRPPRITSIGIFQLERCFACDARAIGTSDQRASGGRIEAACIQHSDTFNGTKGAT